MVNEWLLCDRQVSDGAFRTYLLLLRVAQSDGKCFPGQDTLSRFRNISLRTISGHIKELREKWFISVEQRGNGRTNIYWIEDLSTVYMKDGVITDEVRDRCGSPMGSRRDRYAAEDREDDGLPSMPAPQKPKSVIADKAAMEGLAQTVGAAQRKVQASIDRKAARRDERRAKASSPSAVAKEEKLSNAGDYAKWKSAFREAFPNQVCRPWDGKEGKLLKDLKAAYGVDETVKAMLSLVRNWPAYVDRYKIHGATVPSIGFLYGYRDKIFPELNGLTTRAVRHADEGYEPEGDTDRKGKSGW